MIEFCRLRRSERYEVSSDDAKPSQAMGTADREPAGGEIPVELARRQPLDDFPLVNRGVEDKLIYLLIQAGWQSRR